MLHLLILPLLRFCLGVFRWHSIFILLEHAQFALASQPPILSEEEKLASAAAHLGLEGKRKMLAPTASLRPAFFNVFFSRRKAPLPLQLNR